MPLREALSVHTGTFLSLRLEGEHPSAGTAFCVCCSETIRAGGTWFLVADGAPCLGTWILLAEPQFTLFHSRRT